MIYISEVVDCGRDPSLLKCLVNVSLAPIPHSHYEYNI
jgi:hypothetical protein